MKAKSVVTAAILLPAFLAPRISRAVPLGLPVPSTLASNLAKFQQSIATQMAAAQKAAVQQAAQSTQNAVTNILNAMKPTSTSAPKTGTGANASGAPSLSGPPSASTTPSTNAPAGTSKQAPAAPASDSYTVGRLPPTRDYSLQPSPPPPPSDVKGVLSSAGVTAQNKVDSAKILDDMAKMMANVNAQSPAGSPGVSGAGGAPLITNQQINFSPEDMAAALLVLQGKTQDAQLKTAKDSISSSPKPSTPTTAGNPTLAAPNGGAGSSAGSLGATLGSLNDPNSSALAQVLKSKGMSDAQILAVLQQQQAGQLPSPGGATGTPGTAGNASADLSSSAAIANVLKSKGLSDAQIQAALQAGQLPSLPNMPSSGSSSSLSNVMPNTGATNVQADIYAFMALFQKLAQEMRDSARQDRELSLQSQVSTMQQADKLKDAAQARFDQAMIQGASQIGAGVAQIGAANIGADAKLADKSGNLGTSPADVLKLLNQSTSLLSSMTAEQQAAYQKMTKDLMAKSVDPAVKGTDKKDPAAAAIQGVGQVIQQNMAIQIASKTEAKAEMDAQRAERDAQKDIHDTAMNHANDMMQQMMDVIRDVRDKLSSMEQSGIETNRGVARNLGAPAPSSSTTQATSTTPKAGTSVTSSTSPVWNATSAATVLLSGGTVLNTGSSSSGKTVPPAVTNPFSSTAIADAMRAVSIQVRQNTLNPPAAPVNNGPVTPPPR